MNNDLNMIKFAGNSRFFNDLRSKLNAAGQSAKRSLKSPKGISLAGTALGAGLGGYVGSKISDKEDKRKNSMRGMVVGGLAGLTTAKKINRYNRLFSNKPGSASQPKNYYNDPKAINGVPFEVIKEAALPAGLIKFFNNPKTRLAGGTLVGTGIGGYLGHRKGETDEEKRKNAIKGALMGGGAGLAAGYGVNTANSIGHRMNSADGSLSHKLNEATRAEFKSQRDDASRLSAYIKGHLNGKYNG